MTRILGTLLGVSFQTELLIMTLLGLANSILDWKPFELVLRLNLIRNLHISVNDVQISNNSTSVIKKLLSVTVVVEFFCSLINPFAYILKLYPIITWSRSDVLLLWLTIHALNTILPKMLSLVLAIVFYTQNIISTLLLVEFLIVESINLLIAWYNWYVFFAFYLDLREVDRRRHLRKNEEKFAEKLKETLDTSPQIYTSIPNIKESFRRSIVNSMELKQIRLSRSLTSLDNASQEIDLEENSMHTRASDENLSPFEKSIKFLNITQKELDDARKRKKASIVSNLDTNDDEEGIINNTILDTEPAILVEKSNSSIDVFENNCSCSSSDEDEITILISKKVQTNNSSRSRQININVSQSNVHIKSKDQSDKKLKKIMNRGTQVVENFKKPSLNSLTFDKFNSRNRGSNGKKNDDFHFLLNKNFKLLDKMCRSMNFNNHNIPKTNMQKWLIFRHKFNSSLGGNLSSKKDNSKIFPRLTSNIEYENSESDKIQTDEKKQMKKTIKKQYNKSQNVLITEIISKTRNGIKDLTQSSEAIDAFVQLHKTVNKNKYEKRKLERNVSILKSMKLVKQAESIENQNKIREMKNLQAYNYLTLEQDRREMLQKKKKSKMTSYKNIIKELTTRNSDINSKINDIKVYKRVSQSNYLKLKSNQSKNRALQHYVKYSEFLNNNVKTGLQIVTNKTSECCQNFDENESLNKDKLKNFYCKTANEESYSSDEKVISIENEIKDKNNSMCNIREISPRASEQSSNLNEEKDFVELKQTNDVPSLSQIHQPNFRELIDGINWNNNRSHRLYFAPTDRDNKNCLNCEAEEQQGSRIIIDDDTVNMLQSAFSFSDERDRRFQLGPELNEPYPVFQVVALTIAEIFKSSGWRNFQDILLSQYGNEAIEASVADDIIFCESEMDYIDSSNSEIFEAFESETERIKSTPPDFSQGLQDLLDLSHENAESNVDNVSSLNTGEKKIKFHEDNTEELCFQNSNKNVNIIEVDDEKVKIVITESSANGANEKIYQTDSKKSNIYENQNRTLNMQSAIQIDSNTANKNIFNLSRNKASPEIEENHVEKIENKIKISRVEEEKSLTSNNVIDSKNEPQVSTATKFYNFNLTMNSDDSNFLFNFNDTAENSTIELSENFHNFKKDKNFINFEHKSIHTSNENFIELCDDFFKKITTHLEHVPVNEYKKNLKKLKKSENLRKFLALFEKDVSEPLK